MKRAFSLAAALLLFTFALPALGQSVPTVMTFQGRLAKPDGTPVADTASQSLTFRLYSAATGGTLLWSQSGSLPVRNGTFAARLNFTTGYQNGNTLATTFGNTVFTPYLEVQVGSDTPLTPRQPFTSQAYALYANTALTVPDASITASKISPGAIGSTQLASGLLSPLWNLTGNTGTNPASNFLGTTDNQPLVFRTNNVERVRLLANGYVGIGTNNPVAPLHIVGSNNFPHLKIAASASALYGAFLSLDATAITGNGGGGKDWLIYSTAGGANEGQGKLAFQNYTGGVTPLTLTPTGNVGIGTTAPAYSLDVSGTASMTGFRLNAGAAAGKVLTSDAGGVGAWQTLQTFWQGNSSSIYYTGSRVGIGTTTPGFPLSFPDTLGDKISLYGQSGNNVGFGVQGNQLQIHSDVAASDIVFGYGSSGTLTETMRIKGSGKVGIGTASPETALHIAGSAITLGQSVSGGGGTALSIGLSATTNGNVQMQAIKSAGSYYGDLIFDPAGGNVGIGTVSPTAKLDVAGTAQVQAVNIVGGSDVAEPYQIAPAGDVTPAPGMVVSIAVGHVGQMRVASRAYDRAVGGIISGANGVNPGITLRQKGTIADGDLPVASIGRVWCRCDADANGPIHEGDLLTTSATPGHAMRVTDYHKAEGAMIGKAMSSLTHGKGLVLVLVSLK